MKYKKKPVEIEAIQWNGGNVYEMKNFCGKSVKFEHSVFNPTESASTVIEYPVIHTLEGNMRVSIGDYVIKGVQGEFYPCKPDIFEQTYERSE